MKIFLALAGIVLLGSSAQQCASNKNIKDEAVYKGKLEIKALCMNYTIRLTEGNLDTSMIVASWKDEHSGKSYSNVFGLANPCDFPSSIKEGDEFYFTIDTAQRKECAVCMAYYPTPPKRLFIKPRVN